MKFYDAFDTRLNFVQGKIIFMRVSEIMINVDCQSFVYEMVLLSGTLLIFCIAIMVLVIS